jgi:hypothetical protein
VIVGHDKARGDPKRRAEPRLAAGAVDNDDPTDGPGYGQPFAEEGNRRQIAGLDDALECTSADLAA